MMNTQEIRKALNNAYLMTFEKAHGEIQHSQSAVEALLASCLSGVVSIQPIQERVGMVYNRTADDFLTAIAVNTEHRRISKYTKDFTKPKLSFEQTAALSLGMVKLQIAEKLLDTPLLYDLTSDMSVYKKLNDLKFNVIFAGSHWDDPLKHIRDNSVTVVRLPRLGTKAFAAVHNSAIDTTVIYAPVVVCGYCVYMTAAQGRWVANVIQISGVHIQNDKLVRIS